MKIRKSKVVITSLLSVFGVALLGVTSAKWALTDNADPFHVLITAGNLPEKGYYITFGEDGYFTTGEHCIVMDAGEDDNLAQKTNVHIDDNDTVRIYYYDGNTNEKISSLTTYSFGEAHGYAALGGDNATITFDTARHGDSYSFYLKEESSELKLYMVDETYALYNGYYITKSTDNGVTWCDFNEAWKMDDTSGDNVAELTHAFETGVKYRVEHFAGTRGIISSPNVQGADYSHFTNSVHDNETIDFKAAGNYKFMVSNTTNKTYIAKPSAESLNGYYIMVADNQGNVDPLANSSIKMGNGGQGTDNAAETSTAIAVANGAQIKIAYYDAVNDDLHSFNTLAETSYDFLTNPTLGDIVLTFNKADSYNFYVKDENHGSGIYVQRGNNYTVYLSPNNSYWGQTYDATNLRMVYFEKPSDWGDNVYVYPFKNNAKVDIDWTDCPAATYARTQPNDKKVFGYEVDITKYDCIIFKDAAGNATHQTPDTPVSASTVDGCCYYWDDGSNYLTYTFANPRGNNPEFYAWVWETEKDGRWIHMEASDTHSGYYEITVRDYETNIIFARCSSVLMDDPKGNLLDDQTTVWNKTGDLSLQGNGYAYNISGWSAGDWSVNPL